MSISTLESPASVRALDAKHAAEDEYAATFEQHRRDFLAAAARCDAKAIATFAGTTTDFSQRFAGGGYGRRPQTVGEVVHDALDNRRFRERGMQILLNAAAGRGTQRDAQQLLEEMATAWAEEQVS
jgi:hypothetical protein